MVTDDLDRPPAWFGITAADMVFIVVVLVALRQGQAMLNDPGTFWHIQLGLDIKDSGLPRVDRYSFSRTGEPWLSQTWLCDLGLAALYQQWSWPGVLVASALVLHKDSTAILLRRRTQLRLAAQAITHPSLRRLRECGESIF